jgi:hypothetical protein
MVTITNWFLREPENSKPFIALELTGEVEMIQSSNTGMFYATAKKCTIPSTFSEEVAKSLIGKMVRGRIDRVQTQPYEYTIKDTGEVITLTHTYVYVPEEPAKVVLMAAPSPNLVTA